MRFGVPDVEAGEVGHRPPRRAARGRGRRASSYGVDVGVDVDADELRERHDALVVAIGSRVHRDVDGRRPRARRRPLRDGLPLPAQPLRGGAGGAADARARARHGDRRRRQARRRDRRRRHRHGLHLEREPRGRRSRRRSSTSTSSSTASGRDARTPWPLPPKRTPHDVRARRGRRALVGTEVTGFSGEDGRVTHVHARRVTGTSSRDLQPVPGSEFTRRGRPRADRDRLHRPRARGRDRAARARARPARQRPHAPDLPRRRCRASTPAATRASGSRSSSPRSPRGASCARIVNKDLGGSPMDADREQLAIGAWSGVEDHTLRHEAEAAGSVRLGDDFFSGPGGPI